MKSFRSNLHRGQLLAAFVLLFCYGFASYLSAAESEFVGVMSLAVEPDVAEQLGLSEEEYDKLFNWVDDRELAATDIVLSLRGMPEEQKKKLQEFATESERLGLQMLTAEQRAKLARIQIARAGMESLGREDVLAKLEVSDEQKTEIATLLADRTEALGKARADEKDGVTADYERRLAALLSPEQRLGWEKLAGRAKADAVVAEAADPDAGEPVPPDDADTPKPKDVVVDPVDDAAQPASGETKLKFNFRYAPWETVLEWFADQADLSLELATTPPGTFNYTDRREYTPAEALDLMNSVLLTKGYTLVRHRRLLMVLNLEDGVPANLIETVPLEELNDRGRFELISALFPLEEITAEDAEKEIRKLLGPQGSIVVLPKTKALLITETGGRLRVIRDLLKTAEKPVETVEQQLNDIPLEHALAEEVLAVIRQLMGLPEDRNAMPDGSLRIATDALGTRLFVSGTEENVQKIRDILKLVDVPNGIEGSTGILETPQLEVYSITAANPESVLKVMQTIMAGENGVRLDIDPKTGSLVALARPSQQATIKATIDQMQRDGRVIDVMQLSVVDPQLAVLSINKLFGATEEGADNRAPTVDADPISGQLLVRGTQSQIDQIRTLLEKMGEGGLDDDPEFAQADRGNVRMIPLTGGSARAALDQLEEIWPTMRRNKIRVVTPSAAVREMRTGSSKESVSPSGANPLNLPPDLGELNDLFQRFEIKPREPVKPKDAPPKEKEEEDAEPDSSARRATDKWDGFAIRPDGLQNRPTNSASNFALDDANRRLPPRAMTDNSHSPGRKPAVEVALASYQSEEEAEKDPAEDEPVNNPGADIIVAPGPGGVMIASEDLDALDEFEEMLQMLASRGGADREYTIFYLKYARAEVAAELLTEILGGGGGGGGEGEGGGLFGDLASAALGDAGGGLMGSLLGLGGGGVGAISTSGSVTMVADKRLNALVVQANPTDLDLVEQLLEVVDQEASPEDVQTFARPRLIPIFNTDAEEVAGVVRQVYAERLAGSTSSQQRQPSPEEFMRALRGGRGGRGGGGSSQAEEPKVSIGVDKRSNSLVVSAPEPMFQEIRALVEQLDQAGAGDTETVRVISLKNASPELVQKAIVSITGGQVTSNTSSVGGASADNTSTASQSNGQSQQQPTPQQMQDQIRQRIEMFNAMQRQGQRGEGRGGDERRRRGRGSRGEGRDGGGR